MVYIIARYVDFAWLFEIPVGKLICGLQSLEKGPPSDNELGVLLSYMMLSVYFAPILVRSQKINGL